MGWCGEVQRGFGKGLFPYTEHRHTVLWSLLGDRADASPRARAAAHGQCPTQSGTAPARAVGRDTFPVHQAPSISTNSALQRGMVNQPLTQWRREGCAKSSRDSETAPQQPAAPSHHCFSRDRQAKRELRQPDSSVSRFELWGKKSNAGTGVCKITCQTLLSAPGANHCPAQSWWASQGGVQHSKAEH